MPAPRALAPAVQKALRKLGLARDIDLALHLPLRYEDETRIVPIASARDGELAQIEATVTASEVQLRPRRQLVVQVQDASGECTLRFFSFYPSQQKTLAVGARLRIRGEVRGGFWGRQMLHPVFRQAGGELPTALTPVYPTTAACRSPSCAGWSAVRWRAPSCRKRCLRAGRRRRLIFQAKMAPSAYPVCVKRSLFCTDRRPMWHSPR